MVGMKTYPGIWVKTIIGNISCESVVHTLWECPVYDSIRNTFMVDLMGGSFEGFSTLNNFSKADFILGCENWYRYVCVYAFSKNKKKTLSAKIRHVCSLACILCISCTMFCTL